MKKMAAELATIVAGVLLALAVDEWRQDREELRIANEYLSDVAAEIRGNLCTIERIRVRALGRKIENLQAVLRFLNEPAATVDDPAALLQSFAKSTLVARPWLVDNQFQALQNSGNVRLVRKLQPDLNLAGLYEGADVLFSQIEQIQGGYPIVVNELIPAQLQREFSQLRGYSRDDLAPRIEDSEDLDQAIEGIRTRRGELLGLARKEAAVATAQWYALTRMRRDHEDVLALLAQWDRSPTSVAELLTECVAPRR